MRFLFFSLDVLARKRRILKDHITYNPGGRVRRITTDDLIRAVISRGGSEIEAMETVRNFALECRRDWSQSILRIFQTNSLAGSIAEFLDNALQVHGEINILGIGDIKLGAHFSDWTFLRRENSRFESS